MDRRAFNSMALPFMAVPLLMAHQRAFALSIGNLTNAEASQGLKTALERGALAAVNLLGKPDGFLGNDKVRIPLPGQVRYRQVARRLVLDDRGRGAKDSSGSDGDGERRAAKSVWCAALEPLA